VAFSPDGKRLVSGDDNSMQPGELKLWDADKGQEVLTLKGHAARISSVAFSPDGNRLVSGSDDCTLKVWCEPPTHR
jgi:WD40 repeat protein